MASTPREEETRAGSSQWGLVRSLFQKKRIQSILNKASLPTSSSLKKNKKKKLKIKYELYGTQVTNT